MTEYFDPVGFPIPENTNTTEYLDPVGFPIQEATDSRIQEPSIIPETITEHLEATDSRIQEPSMIEYFELSQGSRGSLPEAEFCRGRVLELRSDSSSVADCSGFDRSKFIRLSCESLPDLKGPQLEVLSDLCLTAHRSEEFFLSVATNQWVRTSITSDRTPEELFCPTSVVEGRSKLISSVTIQSNVLPCDPFWTKLRVRRDGTSKRVHFPCSILKEALREGNTLMEKLLEWTERREECEIGQHGSKRAVDGNIKFGPLRLFWEIRADGEDQDDVKPLKQLAEGSGGTIWLVTWRDGLFVRKDRVRTSNSNDYSDPRDALDTELNVVEKLSHPHIVYSFGVSFATKKSSLFMECMQSDLFTFILDRVTRRMGDNKPPFSHQDSIDILLQVAKAMAHMHEENVVHGDLKSLNILISEFLVSEDVKHYLVKVADFGSAQTVTSNSRSTDFQPGPSTTNYAAPEVLKRRADKKVLICYPKLIDVYSFGIVAFEVLTGEELYRDMRSRTKVEGIIDGTVRPPLRTECQKDNFLHEESLISLIESCLDGDPSKRPFFSKVVDVLNSVRVQILVCSSLFYTTRTRTCIYFVQAVDGRCSTNVPFLLNRLDLRFCRTQRCGVATVDVKKNVLMTQHVLVR